MIKNESSEETILSVKDQNQINLLERRLLTFRTEIGDAKTELETINKEIESSKEAAKYQESIALKLQESNKELREEGDLLISKNTDARTSLTEIENRIKSKTEEFTLREETLKKGEDALKISQIKHDTDMTIHAGNVNALEDHLSDVLRAKEILAKALNDAKW